MKATTHFLIGFVAVGLLTFTSCKKNSDEDQEDKQPTTKTKSYKELWFRPPYGGSTEVHEIAILWEDGKETSYRSYSEGAAMFLYDNNEPLLSVEDKVIWSARDAAAFPADAKDKFKVTMSNGAVITGVPSKDAQILAWHYRGENADLQQVKLLANQQATMGTKDRKFEVLGDTP
uniref:hypothetical protein n=1 Tax=Pedobacter schmidteae TaxID=2201271 RepID=UPI000EB4A372|nr:hypothetical protein [Pedobacter schmidteae]